jgi:hypothetical protein
MLSRTGFLKAIALAIVIGLAFAAVVHGTLGPDKRVMFGWAGGVLVALPILFNAFKRRARTVGKRAWLRFLTLLPLLFFALIVGGFWALFLSSRDGAIMAAMGRNAAVVTAGPWLPWLFWMPFAIAGLHALILLVRSDAPTEQGAKP